jgi:hypothetical protein
MSSIDSSLAKRTGFHHGATTTAVPRSTRDVRPAQYARYCNGFGCIE